MMPFFCVGFLLGFYFLNQFFDEYNREKSLYPGVERMNTGLDVCENYLLLN